MIIPRSNINKPEIVLILLIEMYVKKKPPMSNNNSPIKELSFTLSLCLILTFEFDSITLMLKELKSCFSCRDILFTSFCLFLHAAQRSVF